MNAWNIWTWPWAATMEMWRRSLELAHADLKVVTVKRESGSSHQEPEWTTPNRLVLELASLRLRDFSTKRCRKPVLVVAPFALHDAAIADLAPGHSLLETLRRNGCDSLYLVEWKSTMGATRLNTIDTQLASLNVAVDEIGTPVNLVGLCQGGWLSLVYAARFPLKVRRLVLVGAPVDIKAEPSALTAPMSSLSHVVIDELVRHGDGLLLGADMTALWPHELDEESRVIDSLQLSAPFTSDATRKIVEIFDCWDRRALDLPAPYYRQVVEWLFCENRLATGAFPALGHVIDLHNMRSPIFVLAGAQDVIAPAAQAFAATKLVGTKKDDIETALAPCGHLALFMGQQTLRTEWRRIAQWLLE